MAHLGRNKFNLTRAGLCTSDPAIIDEGTLEDIREYYDEIHNERATPVGVEKWTNTKQDLFTGNNTAGQVIVTTRAVKLPLTIETLVGTVWTPYTTFTRVGQTITLTVAVPVASNNIRVTYDVQEDDVYEEQTSKLYAPPVSAMAIVNINPSPKEMFDLGIREQVDAIFKFSDQGLLDIPLTITTDDRIVFNGIKYSVYQINPEDYVQNKPTIQNVLCRIWSNQAPRTTP